LKREAHARSLTVIDTTRLTIADAAEAVLDAARVLTFT
jgi:hypothetical protein